MKKILTTGALLCIFGLLIAQQPGTIDKSIANNGDYIIAVAGSGVWANFNPLHG